MIYIFKFPKKDCLFITDIPRDIDDENAEIDTELILTIDLDFDKCYGDIESNLRPWKKLDSKEEGYYKNDPEVLDYLKNLKLYKKLVPQQLKYIWGKDIDKLINIFTDAKTLLENLEIINKTEDIVIDKSLVEFPCDVWNLLEDKCKDYKIINKFLHFTPEIQNYIINFYKNNTKESRQAYFTENSIGEEVFDIIEFLPEWCGISLIVSENELKYRNIEYLPEFKSSNRLDGKDELIEHRDDFVKKEIYKRFGTGEIWKGSDIKSELANIYKIYEMPNSARVMDIFNYFETKMTRQGYRLGFKKII